MTTRADLHSIVDALSEDQLQEASAALRAIGANGDEDALTKLLREAPVDDEPFTEEQRQAVEAARASNARGEAIPWETVKASLLDER